VLPVRYELNLYMLCRRKIMIMKMFVTLDKAKLDTENIRGLNLAAVMCMTVQVSRLSL
jgi:hypothetical protein